MVSLTTPSKAQRTLADHARQQRLGMGLTQEGLASRSGVPLPTLRKFEQSGAISLASFLKLQMVLGGLDAIIGATQPPTTQFASIDDVLQTNKAVARKRGYRK
jgi:transcriptional regulator with XRE-family HTH domain